MEGRAPLVIHVHEHPPPEVPVGALHTVRISVEDEGVEIVHCTADYLDPDGQRCAQVQAVATPDRPAQMAGRFTRAGMARVVVRGVTGQGVSAERELEVRVRP